MSVIENATRRMNPPAPIPIPLPPAAPAATQNAIWRANYAPGLVNTFYNLNSTPAVHSYDVWMVSGPGAEPSEIWMCEESTSALSLWVRLVIKSK
jgi:hypothetical protein